VPKILFIDPSVLAQPNPGMAKGTLLAKKLRSSQVLIGIGVGLVAATAGFGIASILPKSQQQPTAKPLVEKPTQESGAKAPNFDSTSSPKSEETNTTSRSEKAPVSNSKQRRRNRRSSQEESTSSPTRESQRGDSEQSTPSPSVSSTPSLVEKLRAIRSSRKASPSPAPLPFPQNNLPASSQNPASPQPVSPSKPLLIPPAPAPPTESKQPDPSAVVVPTLEKQNSPTNSQPQNIQKFEEKPQDDNN
jgi:hypothetical protein